MPSCLLLSGHVAQGVGPVVDFKYEKAKGTRNGPGTLSALLVVLPRSLENIPAPRACSPSSFTFIVLGGLTVVTGTARATGLPPDTSQVCAGWGRGAWVGSRLRAPDLPACSSLPFSGSAFAECSV